MQKGFIIQLNKNQQWTIFYFARISSTPLYFGRYYLQIFYRFYFRHSEHGTRYTVHHTLKSPSLYYNLPSLPEFIQIIIPVYKLRCNVLLKYVDCRCLFGFRYIICLDFFDFFSFESLQPCSSSNPSVFQRPAIFIDILQKSAILLILQTRCRIGHLFLTGLNIPQIKLIS